MAEIPPLSPTVLRWRCDPARLPFETTAEVEPIPGVVGQDQAVEALRFGLVTAAPGHNVYVRGLTGTGRMTLVRRLLEETRPSCPLAQDRLYVHNFAEPEQPRLITLPRGQGLRFSRRVQELLDFVDEGLEEAVNREGLKARREALEARARQEMEALTRPFEEELRANGLALVTEPVGPAMRTRLLPLVRGQPVLPEELDRLEAMGRVSAAEKAELLEKLEHYGRRLMELDRELRRLQRRHHEQGVRLLESQLREVLGGLIADLAEEFPQREVALFLQEMQEDLVRELARPRKQREDLSRRYRVNLLVSHGAGDTCPIIVETAPTVANLLGTVDPEVGPGGILRADHLRIRAGSLVRADGGFLLLEARDVLLEPGAWKALVRTLRTGLVDVAAADTVWPFRPALKPQPIPVQVKVILVGDPGLYHLLDAHDPDFPHLFKVLADFDSLLPDREEGVRLYAGVLARIAREEGLPPFHRTAVAALAEHGARIAGRQDRLTTRFGRLADIAREAAFLARSGGEKHVSGGHVAEAIRRGRERAGLPARRFREQVLDGVLRIRTDGRVVGQVNGLALMHAGPLTYGFPARITATLGPGSAGAVNIEREAQLSGAIHTKGFYILGGLLRHLLRTDHPLAFSASVAFEQSYGGIDGDSASAAEICCLLSALTGVPLRQDLAITGAIDQHGHIQAVGAVTEKIEGFYDVCAARGLTGDQGVIIPRANMRNLMLRPDVVGACAEGRFHVYAVDRIHEALELLTGLPAGELDERGSYPEGTLLGLAMARARLFWEQASGFQGPGSPPESDEEESD